VRIVCVLVAMDGALDGDEVILVDVISRKLIVDGGVSQLLLSVVNFFFKPFSNVRSNFEKLGYMSSIVA